MWIADRCCDSTRNTVAPTVDAQHRSRQLARFRGFTHVANGIDTALQRISFEIESARVDQTARSLESNPHLPTTTRSDLGNVLGIPRQSRQPTQRNRLAGECCRLDPKHETARIFTPLRQLIDGADDVKIAPFEFEGESRIHRPLTTQCAPRECEHDDRNPPRARKAHGVQRRERNNKIDDDRKLRRQCLRRQHAGENGERRDRCNSTAWHFETFHVCPDDATPPILRPRLVAVLARGIRPHVSPAGGEVSGLRTNLSPRHSRDSGNPLPFAFRHRSESVQTSRQDAALRFCSGWLSPIWSSVSPGGSPAKRLTRLATTKQQTE